MKEEEGAKAGRWGHHTDLWDTYHIFFTLFLFYQKYVNVSWFK